MQKEQRQRKIKEIEKEDGAQKRLRRLIMKMSKHIIKTIEKEVRQGERRKRRRRSTERIKRR